MLNKYVSTGIRNLYSKGYSAIFVSFYGMNLSFRFMPFVPRPAKRDSIHDFHYDNVNAITTTVDCVGAFALYEAATNIINGKEASQGMQLTIPCAAGVSLVFERKPGQDGQMETFLVIIKNDVVIPFKFNTYQAQVRENGQMVTKITETGLGTFAMTIFGYLTGIGAGNHLSKLFDEEIDPEQSPVPQE